MPALGHAFSGVAQSVRPSPHPWGFRGRDWAGLHPGQGLALVLGFKTPSPAPARQVLHGLPLGHSCRVSLLPLDQSLSFRPFPPAGILHASLAWRPAPPTCCLLFCCCFLDSELSSARQMGFDGSYKGRLQLVALWKCFLGLAY